MPQSNDGLALFQLSARPLGLTAKFVLGRLDFLSGLGEVFLLESQPIFEDGPFVPQFRELLFALPNKHFLSFVQLRVLFLFCGLEFGELLLSQGEEFVPQSSDGGFVNFASVIEIGSFAVSLGEKLGSRVVED